MIAVGVVIAFVGAFLALISAAGFDEARKETREFGLPSALLVIALAVVIWGIWLAKS